MSGFSVANNITLRNYYATYRDFTVKSNRANATTNQLNYADAQALRRAVRKLDDFDFENADKTDLSCFCRHLQLHNGIHKILDQFLFHIHVQEFKKSCKQISERFGKYWYQGKFLWLFDIKFFCCRKY